MAPARLWFLAMLEAAKSSTTTTDPGTRPPAPPQPVAEPTVVPPEPVRDDAIASASLDDLNRNSPLKPLFFELDSAEVNTAGQAVSASMDTTATRGVVGPIVGGLLNALVGWAVWSYVIYYVGTRFMGGTATYGELLRTLGFAQTPNILHIFNFIPVLGGLLSLVAFVWFIVAGFIAARQALDLDNVKTFWTIVLGAVALIVVFAVVGLVVALIFGAGVYVGRLL